MFSHILLPLDIESPPTFERALPLAVELAQTHGARLHVMTVIPEFGSAMVASFFPRDFEHKAIERGRIALEAFARNHIPADLDHQLIVAHGRIYREICRVAEEVEADLVVMASHKPELSDALLAANAEQVLRHLPVSVMIVR